MKYIIYSEFFTERTLERWFYGRYDDVQQANEIAISLHEQNSSVWYCVTTESNAKALGIQNMPKDRNIKASATKAIIDTLPDIFSRADYSAKADKTAYSFDTALKHGLFYPCAFERYYIQDTDGWAIECLRYFYQKA